MSTRPAVLTVLVGWLTEQLGEIRVCTELPQNLETQVPLVQLVSISDALSGSAQTQGTATVDVNAFGADDDAAEALALQVEALLLDTRGVTTGGAVIRNIRSRRRPARTPYENTQVRLYAAMYEIRIHPAPAPA